jgi:hypothetical protein
MQQRPIGNQVGQNGDNSDVENFSHGFVSSRLKRTANNGRLNLGQAL